MPPFPNPVLNGPLGVTPSGPLAQGQIFSLHWLVCDITRSWVEITTQSPYLTGRAWDDGHVPPFTASIPDCQPTGQALVTLYGRGSAEPDFFPPHWRKSEVFTITPGSQACVYSANVNPAQLLQGDQQVVYWSAPNNQVSARAYLHYFPGGGVVNMAPYGGGSDGRFGTVTGSVQQFQWQVPSTLPPGTYFANVRAFNGAGQFKEASTPTITVGPRPTVSNVQATPATIYAGSDVNVSWSSTYQSSWKLYRCDTAGQNCSAPVQSGNGGTAQTTWTTPLTPIGTFKLKVEVSSTSGATASALSGPLTIQPRPTITVQWSAASVNVPESGTVAPSVVVTTSNGQATLNQVVVNFETEDITAVAGNDYSYRQGQIVVPQGTASGSGSLAIPNPIGINADTAPEGNEQFRVNLTGISGLASQLGTGQTHVVTILDDDQVALSVQDIGIGEGGTAQVVVALSIPSPVAVSVNFATVATGSAIAGQDYQPTSGTLSWPANNNTPKTVPVTTLPDDIYEGNETLVLRLSAPQNATIQGSGDGLVTIMDDEQVPTLSVANAVIVEGDAGTSPGSVVLTLNHPSVQSVTGSWVTADGTALAGFDYTQASGTFTIAPLQTSTTLPLTVLGDLLDEDDETFSVALSGVANAQPPAGGALVTITDNDPLPQLSLGDVIVPEGDTGTSAASFPLSLSTASGRDVRVSYQTGTGSASANSDYLPVAGNVLFKPGEVSYDVPVAVRGDRRHEGDESFALDLASPQNASLADGAGVGTVVDDDADQPAVDDLIAIESAAEIRFEVTGPQSGSVTVSYETLDGSALAGQDYQPAVGTLTLNPGIPSSVTLSLLSDALQEAPESFSLVLRDTVTSAEVARGTATVFERPVAGDFNANGAPDLVWRKTDGSIETWLMAGVKRISTAPTNPNVLASNWELAGTADFNADRQSDLLWLNRISNNVVVWFMNGVARSGASPTSPGAAADSNWKIAGTGDFNQDFQPDILWRNTGSGKTVAWLMDGVVRTAGLFTTPDGVAGLNWVVQGVGDFNGDGRPDLLWRNAVSGRTVIWLMNGLERTSGSLTAPVGENELDWEVGAIADYTADGRADIAWRNQTTGALRLWSMDGLLRLQNLPLSPGQQPDLAWVLKGPR